jgi:hypothetical protein
VIELPVGDGELAAFGLLLVLGLGIVAVALTL